MFPEPVLLRAKEEFLDWQGCGLSVLAMSHRGKEFISIAEKSEQDLRQLLAIPANYKVLFLQGGASSQFAMVPLNLLGQKSTANYVCTGAWSDKAIQEAQKFCRVHIAASSRDTGFKHIPNPHDWDICKDAAYLHYTSNETIGGVEFHYVPDVDGMPLISDMSSNILSEPIDINQFGLIYAGAQKNMGPAGIAVVIVREDLLGNTPSTIPTMYDLLAHAKSGSMLNTPATYNWYLMGLVFEWLIDRGGVEALEVSNKRKAEKLYRVIDDSGFYTNPVDPSGRSRMNIPFLLAETSLEKTFLSEATKENLVALEGHRSVGGMRASIYNAMPEEGVDALIGFMIEFERCYG